MATPIPARNHGTMARTQMPVDARDPVSALSADWLTARFVARVAVLLASSVAMAAVLTARSAARVAWALASSLTSCLISVTSAWRVVFRLSSTAKRSGVERAGISPKPIGPEIDDALLAAGRPLR